MRHCTLDDFWNNCQPENTLKSHQIVWIRNAMTQHSSEEHYSGIIISVMASQNTSVSIVCSNVCSGADQRKRQSSAPLVFVKGIHRWPVDWSASPLFKLYSPAIRNSRNIINWKHCKHRLFHLSILKEFYKSSNSCSKSSWIVNWIKTVRLDSLGGLVYFVNMRHNTGKTREKCLNFYILEEIGL